MNDLETIRTALYSGQISAAKVDAQRVFVRVARRDWAVRVLDAWGRRHRKAAPRPVPNLDREGRFVHFAMSDMWGLFVGDTEESARLVAAEAVYAELPADVRADLGEHP